eukprot:364188-Chlamydomonas_euryale.AAC.9
MYFNGMLFRRMSSTLVVSVTNIGCGAYPKKCTLLHALPSYTSLHDDVVTQAAVSCHPQVGTLCPTA